MTKEPFWHAFSSHHDGSKRWFLHWGRQLAWGFGIEFSRRWRYGLNLTAGYGGQENFVEATVAIPFLFFFHIAFDTPWRWKKLRPFDGKYSESEATFGLRTVGGTLYLLVGHDSMGTYYGTHGRGGPIGRWLRDIKRNKQVTLFRGDWILGKPRHTLEVLQEAIPITVNVGQWDGDSYRGTAKHTRRTRKRRFTTKVSDGYEIDMEEGIPFPGKGENSWDMGDDAYFGFGGATIEAAVADIIADTLDRRNRHGGKNWRPAAIGGVA